MSITDRQNDFVRRLVARGHYGSMSTVVQHGLEPVRAETEREENESQGLEMRTTRPLTPGRPRLCGRFGSKGIGFADRFRYVRTGLSLQSRLSNQEHRIAS